MSNPVTPFNTPSAADAVVTALKTVTGLTHAQLGAPESIGPKVCAYVTLGAQSPTRIAGGVTAAKTHLFVDFAYRLDGDESGAERAMMTAVDQFIAALYRDLTLGGAVKDLEIQTGMSETPEYRVRAGKEYREYPVLLAFTQYGTYNVNP